MEALMNFNKYVMFCILEEVSDREHRCRGDMVDGPKAKFNARKMTDWYNVGYFKKLDTLEVKCNFWDYNYDMLLG